LTGQISVVVATCNRPRELRECLNSLLDQTLPAARIVVVDDAPWGSRTPAVAADLRQRGPVRYVATLGRGLAAAHNRGLLEVETPLVAFTDDDVVATPEWLEHLVAAFSHAPDVGCVTGRIVAHELETPPQRWLDRYAAFDKGMECRMFDLDGARPADPLFPFAAGVLGSGANMAFSAGALRGMGGFDPALGAGTRARGGDDLSAFFEVLQSGYRLVYEPRALVRHRHAPDYQSLRRQVFGYGVGLTAYLTKCAVDRPRLIGSAARRMPHAMAHVLHPGSAKNARLPDDYPSELTRLERLGMLAGPLAYVASRREAARQRERLA
jgi:GT2 family glycosyltransferase